MRVLVVLLYCRRVLLLCSLMGHCTACCITVRCTDVLLYCRREVREAVEAIYRERANMAAALKVRMI